MKQWIVAQWAKEKEAAARVWFNFLGIWVSLDQSAGMILGFIMHPASKELWPDETLSARCGRLGRRYPYKFWRWFIDTFLFAWWQGPNHCVNAYRKELTRYHFHPSMRDSSPAVCTLPPAGWYCTRTPGHDGPCAAHPESGD